MPLWIFLFLSFLVVFAVPLYVWRCAADRRRQRRTIAAIVSGAAPVTAAASILVPRQPPAGAQEGRARFALLSAGAALAGLLAGLLFQGLFGALAPIAGALAGAILPRMYRAKKRRKWLARIEAQFPDALDFLGRSLRAGNAFSVGLELLCPETIEPLQGEIRKLSRELALGARLEDSFTELIVRVPLVEIRFFASAVLLQRDTGGNLSEVIGNLAVSLRERFRLRSQVRAASGQGRLTATVLTVLPIATLVMLHFASPDYLSGLTGTPLGRNLLAAAAVFQVIGYSVMKRIIDIEV